MRIRALNKLGYGEWSDLVWLTTEPTAPDRPPRPSALSLNSTSIELYMPWPKANGRNITTIWVQTLANGEVTPNGDVYVDVSDVLDQNATILLLPRNGANSSESYQYAAGNAVGFGEFSPALVAGNELTFEPAAPTIQTVDGITARSANVTFLLPTTTNNPSAAGFPVVVKSALVQVEDKTGSEPIKSHPLSQAELRAICALGSNGALEAGPCDYGLMGLAPNNQYSVSAIAISDEGTSPPSSPAFNSARPPLRPTRSRTSWPPHSRVRADTDPSAVSDGLSVTWATPLHHNGDDVDTYIIYACVVPDELDCATSGAISAPSITSGSVATGTITGLAKGTNYRVYVEARNSQGPSPNASLATQPFVTTYDVPHVPAQPGEGVALAGLPTTTTIHFVWTAPWANGCPLETYDIIIDSATVGRHFVVNASLFPQHIYTNLEPGTNHTSRSRRTTPRGPRATPRDRALHHAGRARRAPGITAQSDVGHVDVRARAGRCVHGRRSGHRVRDRVVRGPHGRRVERHPGRCLQSPSAQVRRLRNHQPVHSVPDPVHAESAQPDL